jgi:hypothetical protein
MLAKFSNLTCSILSKLIHKFYTWNFNSTFEFGPRFPRDSLVLGEQGAARYMTPDAE